MQTQAVQGPATSDGVCTSRRTRVLDDANAVYAEAIARLGAEPFGATGGQQDLLE